MPDSSETTTSWNPSPSKSPVVASATTRRQGGGHGRLEAAIAIPHQNAETAGIAVPGISDGQVKVSVVIQISDGNGAGIDADLEGPEAGESRVTVCQEDVEVAAGGSAARHTSDCHVGFVIVVKVSRGNRIDQAADRERRSQE